MVTTVDNVIAAARRAREQLYIGRCTISEYRQLRDEASKISSGSEVVAYENLPCRLSYEKIVAAGGGMVAAVSQQVKLFLAPEVVVKPGSKITVEQDGHRQEFAASGEPAVYATHQEIMLEIFRGWA